MPAEDVPTDPQEPIRRITTSDPSDNRSPFFDPFNTDMKPMAKLYINRQRIYEKVCEDMPGNPSNSGGRNNNPKNHDKHLVKKACKMTQWGDWSPCSVTCGQGHKLRQRSFEDDYSAHKHKCNKSLSDRRPCFSVVGECELSPKDSAILKGKNCGTESWSSWSECTATCGPAVRTRSRTYKNKQHAKYCRLVSKPPQLQQTKNCDNEPCQECEGENCEKVRTAIDSPDNETETESKNFEESDEDEDEGGEELEEEVVVTEEWLEKCPPSRFSNWSMWSPCSTSCGPGIKLRSRLIEKNWNAVGEVLEEDDESLEECKVQQATCKAKIESCNFTKEDAQKICFESKDKGNEICNSNIIRFYYDQEEKACKHFSYTGCDGNRNNFQTMKDCIDVCSGVETIVETTPEGDFNGIQTGSQIIDSTEEYRGKIDCEYTDWSKWSECVDCNDYAFSVREITTRPRNGGKKCSKKLEKKRKCRKFPACSIASENSIRRRSRDWASVANEYNDNNSQSIESVDCVLTNWSSWSRCTATCGESLQHRTRTFRVKPRKHGRLCPPLAEFRECTVPECY